MSKSAFREEGKELISWLAIRRDMQNVWEVFETGRSSGLQGLKTELDAAELRLVRNENIPSNQRI